MTKQLREDRPATKVSNSFANQPQNRLARAVSLDYIQLPGWYQDIKFIHSGSRAVTGSISLCLASWAYLHNETGNVFSHHIPALFSTLCEALLFVSFYDSYPCVTTSHQLIFAFFLFTIALCLRKSSIYHALLEHSSRLSYLWLFFDYISILVLTLGDFILASTYASIASPFCRRLIGP